MASSNRAVSHPFHRRPYAHMNVLVQARSLYFTPTSGLQELDQQLVHIGGALLLYPVARALKQNLFLKVGNAGFPRLVRFGIELDDGILVACDEQSPL